MTQKKEASDRDLKRLETYCQVRLETLSSANLALTCDCET